MGIKKKLNDIAIKVTIRMWNKKMTVDFDAEIIFDEVTHTIHPPKKDDGNMSSFYEILLARYEITRQLGDLRGEIPSNLSMKIKSMIK